MAVLCAGPGPSIHVDLMTLLLLRRVSRWSRLQCYLHSQHTDFRLTLNSSCCFITWWHPATLGIDLEPLWNRWWKVTALETVYKELVYCSYSAAAWSLLCFCSLSGHQSYWVLGLYSSANIETQLLAKLIDQQHNIKRELLLLYRLCCYSQCSGNKRQELKHLEIDFQWE